MIEKSLQGLALPGGHINGNESIMACAIRKIEEETGCASTQFLTTELLSSFVHESRRRDYEEVLTEAKKLAVDYFKLPDDEIETFYRENTMPMR